MSPVRAHHNEICFMLACGLGNLFCNAAEWAERPRSKALSAQRITRGLGLLALSLSAERIVAHPSGFWNSHERRGFSDVNQQ
jgi:hypothetical protein